MHKIKAETELAKNDTTEMHKVTEEILGNLSLFMGMNKDGLRLLHGEMKQAMRLNYYPTCSRHDRSVHIPMRVHSLYLYKKTRSLLSKSNTREDGFQ